MSPRPDRPRRSPDPAAGAGVTAATTAYYMDTSALAKLVVAEPESEELREWVATCIVPERVDTGRPAAAGPGTEAYADADDSPAVLCSSDLARTELFRAVLRHAPDESRSAWALQAQAVLDRLVLLRATPEIFATAGRLTPSGLRSLDAVHLASALALGDALGGIVTYDERLAEAARLNGIGVLAPGV